MMIRILCIVIAFIVATVKSYETRVVSRYLAERTKPPVMLATIVQCEIKRLRLLRDSNIFTQHKLLEEALNYKTNKKLIAV